VCVCAYRPLGRPHGVTESPTPKEARQSCCTQDWIFRLGLDVHLVDEGGSTLDVCQVTPDTGGLRSLVYRIGGPRHARNAGLGKWRSLTPSAGVYAELVRNQTLPTDPAQHDHADVSRLGIRRKIYKRNQQEKKGESA
jgi:hypothetical protein